SSVALVALVALCATALVWGLLSTGILDTFGGLAQSATTEPMGDSAATITLPATFTPPLAPTEAGAAGWPTMPQVPEGPGTVPPSPTELTPSATQPAALTDTPLPAQPSPTPAPPTSTPLPTATLAPSVATPPPPPTTTPITGPRVGNGPDAHALHLAPGETITVDGNLADWNLNQPIPVGAPVWGPENWAGPEDVSGTTYFAWDDTYLYLAVSRVDNEHLQTRTGYDLYRDDSVEMWIDSDLFGDLNDPVANEGGLRDDFHFAFSAGDFNAIPPAGVIYFPERNEQWNQQLVVAAAPADQGYTLEARVPWSLMNVAVGEGDIFGYVVALNDNDAPQTEEQQVQVASNRERPWRRPLTFGNLILVP
ncbi:MAG: sugar-binding protein, partial [Ardenticatenaceae bacterium]